MSKSWGIEKLHPPQLQAMPSVFSGKNILLAIPTASGKSLVAYLAIMKKLLVDEIGTKAVYIVPLKALASEKFDDLKSMASAVNLTVGLAIGDSSSEAKKIEELINSSDLLVNEVTQKPVKSKPKPPFITSTLQQAASTKLGFNVKRTMRTAQKLYENGLITYMRTDAPALSPESIKDARMYIENNLGEKYLTNAPRIYSSNENAQEAHEAIRPTNASTKSDGLISSTDEEKRLYELIWQQFIGSQLPDAEYLATNAKIQLDGYIFSATGREVVFDGFTRVVKAKSDDKESNILPSLEVLSLIHI